MDVFAASGDTDLGVQWMQEFPNYTKDNIRNYQVMRLNGATYYFVHESHPVISLLYHNQDKLGTRIEESDKVNGQWYRIDCHVFEDSCDTLETDVFSKTPQVYDLTKLMIRLRRPDNKRWMDPPMLCDSFLDSTKDRKTKEDIYRKYSETPIYVVARVQIDYCIPVNKDMAASFPNGAIVPSA